MGNFYEKPAQKGNSPYTRTGEAIPKLGKMAGSDAPLHRVNNPMSLELHMADERVRQAGLSEAEREWRHKWLKDQHLHTNEPVHVDAVYRQLNPVRLVMRLPMDKLYVHFLRPTFGSFYGYYIRHVVPRVLLGFFIAESVYYLYKYENKDWQKREGFRFYPQKRIIAKEEEIKEKYPGLGSRA
uniref:NADH dehydrogenase [ubiquinone] 1 beta subcomplex subunit 6 n=1 Tax=Ditylenchus dipsaci TaxID=166011 RepID=A0A915EL22_9BILA